MFINKNVRFDLYLLIKLPANMSQYKQKFLLSLIVSRGMQVNEGLRMQMEVQRRLHEQLEVRERTN